MLCCKPDTSLMITAPGFDALTPQQKVEICNGCGAKSSKVDFVPDELLGATFTEACDRHDYEYWLGQNKQDADRHFLHNLVVCCSAGKPDRALYLLRCDVAFEYFKAVVAFGDSSFGKK